MLVDVVFLKGEGLGSLDEDCSVWSWGCTCQHVGPRRDRSGGSFLESGSVRAARGWEVARHEPRAEPQLSRTQWLPEGAGSWGMAKVCVSEAMEETASLWMCWRNLFQPGKWLSGLAKGKADDRTSLPNHGRRFLYKLLTWFVLPMEAKFHYLTFSCSTLC